MLGELLWFLSFGHVRSPVTRQGESPQWSASPSNSNPETPYTNWMSTLVFSFGSLMLHRYMSYANIKPHLNLFYKIIELLVFYYWWYFKFPITLRANDDMAGVLWLVYSVSTVLRKDE